MLHGRQSVNVIVVDTGIKHGEEKNLYYSFPYPVSIPLKSAAQGIFTH